MSKILSRKRAWIGSVVVAGLFVFAASLPASAEPLYGGGGPSSPNNNSRYTTGYTWDGFSTGLHVGFVQGWSQVIEPPFSSDQYRLKGASFGGNATYLMRYGNTAIHGGLRAEMDWANINGTASTNCPGCETKVNYFGRGVYMLGYGYPMGNYTCYPYVDGGLAVANVQFNVPGFSGVNQTKTGWTVGGGVELMFHKNWAAALDYSYNDVRSGDCTFATCGANATVPAKFHAVRFGLNYHFGNW